MSEVNGNSNKKVSVIIPTYNGELFIEECLESVINQSYPSIEIIVVDDASTDSTKEILKKYGAKITLIENKENLGLIKSCNKCISLCTGDYMIVFGHDDLMMPKRIEKQVLYMNKNPSALASFGNSYYILDGKQTTRKIINKEKIKSILFNTINNSFLLYCCHIWYNSNSAIFRRDAVVLVGGYPEYLRNFGESFLFFKIGLLGPVRYQNEVLSYYRLHNSNMFGGESKAVKKDTTKKIFELFFENENFQYKSLYELIYKFVSKIK